MWGCEAVRVNAMEDLKEVSIVQVWYGVGMMEREVLISRTVRQVYLYRASSGKGVHRPVATAVRSRIWRKGWRRSSPMATYLW